MRLPDVQIGTRLAGGFGLVLFLLFGVGVAGYAGLSRARADVTAGLEQDGALARSAGAARAAIGSLRRYEKDLFLNADNGAKVSAYRKKWEEARDAAEGQFRRIETLARGRDEAALVRALRADWASYLAGFDQVSGFVRSGQITSGSAATEAMADAEGAARAMEEKSEQLAAAGFARLGGLQTRLEAQARAIQAVVGVLCVAGLLVGGVLSALIARSITAPLARVAKALSADGEEAARGLSAQAGRRDEVGAVLRAALAVIGRIREAGREVSGASVEVASVAEELSASTAQMACANAQVSSQAQNLAAAAEQMTGTVDAVAASAGGVGEAAAEAHRVASQGSCVVSEAVAALCRMAETMERAANAVAALGARSEQIGVVIGVIEAVADQTNLLALNAAIEAARAGDHGRGFAVVADEVRKLAEKTVTATAEISATVAAIQAETRGAVEAMEHGRAQAAEGGALASRAGEAIASIEGRVAAASAEVARIVGATRGLSATIHAASQGVDQIAQGTRQSASGADEIARLAEALTRRAEELKSVTRVLSG